jgi:hypothetical protein
VRLTKLVQFAAAGLASFTLCLDEQSSAADLYVSEGAFTGAHIYKFTPDGTQSTFASNRTLPTGLAVDSSGNLFEAEPTSTIYKFTPDGTPSTFATIPAIFAGLTFDGSGNLFAMTYIDILVDSGIIYKFAPDGSRTTFASGLSRQVNGLAIDANQNVYVGDDQNLSIYKYSPAGVRSTFATGVTPASLAIDSQGNLFETDISSQSINRFTPDGTKSTFSAVSSGSLAIDPNDNLYLGFSLGATKAIYRFAPDGSQSTFATISFVPGYMAFAVPEPSGLALSITAILGAAVYLRVRSRRQAAGG